MRRYILIIPLMLLVHSLAMGQDVSSQSQRVDKLNKDIAYIDNLLKANASKQKATSQQLSLLRKKVANRKDIISEMDGEISGFDRQIALKNQEIADLQSELDTLEEYYNRLIYNTYKNRDTKVWFMYILASENIGQGYRRFAYLKNLSNVVNNQVNNIKGTQADLESEKKELNILKSSAKQMRGEQQKEYDKLRKEEDRSNQVAKTLSNNQTKYKQDLAQKKREVERLNKEIERILNKSIQTQNKNKTDVDYTLTGMFEQNKGKLPWPVKQGVITDKFGVHFDPVYKNLKLPENNGINISTSKNADACCVFDGVVKQVVFIQGYSSCVLVQHGTFYTFYCKLKKASVKAGQRVSTGESLGTIDESNGVSIIHFEIWKGMEKQNPETWLRP